MLLVSFGWRGCSHPRGHVLPGGASGRNVDAVCAMGGALFGYGSANSGMASMGSGSRVRIASRTGSHPHFQQVTWRFAFLSLWPSFEVVEEYGCTPWLES